jgi:hypothetical protein
MSLILSLRLLSQLLVAAALLASVHHGYGQDAKPARTFIDYFLPMPITGTLSKEAWGAGNVGPRDPKNGLEDATLKEWNYWDGKIIKGSDGKYTGTSGRLYRKRPRCRRYPGDDRRAEGTGKR